MTTVMNPAQQHLPHRKPVPGRAPYNNFQQQQEPSSAYPLDQPRAREGSKSMQPNSSPVYGAQPQQTQYAQPTRRTPSNATSTSSTNAGLDRASTNSSAPRRSTSSRSTSSASPTSYVALMRKQKATVWCDRAQQEDPGRLAQQRRDKMKAQMAVAGSTQRFSTSSNHASGSTGIRSKIRHHGAPKASTYTGQANLAGAGVPMRLSATEVDENDSDEEDSKYMNYHRRNGSGKWSTGSGQNPRDSTSSTPRSGHSPDESMERLAEEEETPVPNEYNMKAGDYLQAGSSDEDSQAEASYGRLSALPQSTGKPEMDKKTAEELRRRGSVDDRSMSMTGTKLFIANPDLD